MLLVALLFFAYLTVIAFLGAWTWWDPRGDSVHFAKTADGFELALHELKPVTVTAARPVILCHGILMSRQCWLPHDGVPSVAEELRKRGYWVWILEMRGSGRTRPRRWDYGFFDYANFDLPAAVDEVKRRTGAERVDWVGHSLGGMVCYAHLARHGAGALHKVVTLGSPVRLGPDANGLPRLPFTRALLGAMRSVDFSRLNLAVAPFLIPAWMPWVAQFWNARGMSRRFSLGVFLWCVQRTSTRMILDLEAWQRASGAWLPRVAPPPYAQPPGGLLALHGREDRMAPPSNVESLREFFPQAVVEPADEPAGRGFGHLDLLAGPAEVARVAERIHRHLSEVP